MKKYWSFLILVVLLSHTQTAYSDQIVALTPSEVKAANAIVKVPSVAQALSSCPAEVEKIRAAGAKILSGTEASSFYGLQYSFDFKAGKSVGNLVVRIEYRDADGSSWPTPKISCELQNSTNLAR